MMFRRLDLCKVLSTVVATAVTVSAFAQDGPPRRGGGPGGFGGGGGFDKIDKSLLEGIPPVLRKMVEQAAKNRYSGERLLEFKSGPERKRHTEFIFKDGVRTRIWFPKDSPFYGQIIVEDGRQRQQYFPDRNEIEVSPMSKEELVGKLYGMLRAIKRGGVKVTSRAGDAVAGYKTELVEVTDERGNPFQRMWIEPRSGVLLKREFYEPGGSVMGSFEFKQINLNPQFNRGDFGPLNIRGAKFITQRDLAKRRMAKEGFDVAFLPSGSGFELEGSRYLEHEGSKTFIQFYRYNGKVVTLVQVLGQLSRDRLVRLAGPRANVQTWSEGNHSYAIIGEIPQEQLEKLEDAVRGREA